MLETPWSDGVTGISQRPIEPGHTFTYRFHATVQGSYWYHAHYRAQIEDGLMGSIIVHPKPDLQKPWSLISSDSAAQAAMENAERNTQPLLITDWLRLTSEEKHNLTLKSGMEIPCYDAMLFNGKGNIECLPPNVMNANMGLGQRTNLAVVPGAQLTDKG
jgi:FtsP/CotA-like multicopper oxidase with cupredoxin domain